MPRAFVPHSLPPSMLFANVYRGRGRSCFLFSLSHCDFAFFFFFSSLRVCAYPCPYHQRVMRSCFLVLFRLFLRVDGVVVRCRETRYFHRLSRDASARASCGPIVRHRSDRKLALTPNVSARPWTQASPFSLSLSLSLSFDVETTSKGACKELESTMMPALWAAQYPLSPSSSCLLLPSHQCARKTRPNKKKQKEKPFAHPYFSHPPLPAVAPFHRTTARIPPSTLPTWHRQR